MKKLFLILVIFTLAMGLCATGRAENMPWSDYMRLPSQSEINSFNASGRAPYIVCAPQFSGSKGYVEYAVDFRADYLPNGTYLAVCNFDIDYSSLLSRYKTVSRDYNGVGAYCGFQRGYNGEGIAIMTVWDTYCTDYNGNRTTIKATGVQAVNGEFERNKDNVEGSFIHCLASYNWQEGQEYRALIQLSGSRLVFWVQNLSTQVWTQLMEFDLGYEGGYIKSTCAFLEDFSSDSRLHAAVRTMSLRNFRVKDASSGKWIGAKTAVFAQNYNYSGSYNYGSKGDTFWVITTNMENRCSKPAQNKTCTVNYCDSSSPY